MLIELSKTEYIAYFESGQISLWARDICKFEGKYYTIKCGSTDSIVVLEPTEIPTKED